MSKLLQILTYLYAAQNALCHPIVSQTPDSAQAVPPSPPVQAPLLFELTRGAPYSTQPRSLPLTGGSVDLQLTHVTDDYFLKLQIAGEERDFRIDTGSATFWAADASFKCFNIHRQVVGSACCGLGLDSALKLNATNETVAPFYQAYRLGSYAKGTLTTTEISFNDTALSVTVGLADSIRYEGSRIEAGVLGLAGPGFYMGDSLSPNESRPKPFFSQLIDAFPSLPNFFTLALSRQSTESATNAASYIEFGGRLLRAPGIATTGSVAIVPLLTVAAPVVQRSQAASGNSTGLVAEYITLGPAFAINGTAVLAPPLPLHTKIDSSYPGLVLPSVVAQAFNKLWLDGRIYASSSAFNVEEPVEVDCAATPPSLTITYNDVDFGIDARDLVQRGADGRCRSLVTGSRTAGVLGVPFLKNVVALHHVGARRMELTARAAY